VNDERQNAVVEAEVLPLFPLPRYTLFPNTLVPFHVYDRRDRRMIADCLSGGRMLVVAGLAPGWEQAPPDVPPPVVGVGGLGRVLSDRRYPDGRFDLFVHGLARVRIVRALRHAPWTVVEVEPWPDRAERPVAGALQRLAAVAGQLADALGEDGQPVREVLRQSGDPGVLSNRLAAVLVDDFAARQRLLETRCPVARCEALVAWLGERLVQSTWDDAGGGVAH